MHSDPLPTADQKRRLCDLSALAFVELRALSLEGRHEQAADLADAFHNILKEMYGWGSFSWSIFRGMVADYQAKWKARQASIMLNYVDKIDEIRCER